MFTTEQEFNKEVVNFLRKKITEEGLASIRVVGGYDSGASDNYLLRDFTFNKTDNSWYLYGGFQEIDVILYKETIPREQLLGSFVKSTGVGVRGNIIVPSVIIELKKASRRKTSKLSSFPSHDAIATNVIAGDVKKLFPRVKAMFLFDNFEGVPSTFKNISFNRMLYNFDGIYLDWKNDKERIWKVIKGCLV
ncbi:MAG: hypothetical protein AAB609_01525 [Patescibacteria group bacterium]